MKLAADGLVRTVNPDDADARRAPYEITQRGIAALEAWVAAPKRPALGPYHDELSTRALLSDMAGHQSLCCGLELWESQLSLLERSLEGAIGPGHAVPGDSGPSRGHRARSIILERCLEHTRIDLEFVRKLCAASDLGSGGMAGRGRLTPKLLRPARLDAAVALEG